MLLEHQPCNQSCSKNQSSISRGQVLEAPVKTLKIGPIQNIKGATEWLHLT